MLRFVTMNEKLHMDREKLIERSGIQPPIRFVRAFQTQRQHKGFKAFGAALATHVEPYRNDARRQSSKRSTLEQLNAN